MRQGFVDLHAEWPLVRKMEMAVSKFPHQQRVGAGDVGALRGGDTESVSYEVAIDR